jgi:hypothetical protein
MTISFTCPSGHRLTAKESQAGKSFHCPKCQMLVMVPGPIGEVRTDLPLHESDMVELIPLESTPPTLPGSEASSSQRSTLSQDAPAPRTEPVSATGRLPYVLVGAGAAGGSLLGLLLMFGIWLLSGQDDQPQIAPVAPSTTQSPGEGKAEPAGNTVRVDDAAPHAPVTPPFQDDPATTAAAAAPESLPRRFKPAEDIASITSKLRQIGLAFHYFHDSNRCLAPPTADGSVAPKASQATSARAQQPTALSWRVHLLPYLEQQPLYDQFQLDEPWDSPHNKSLLEHMPEVFRIGSSTEPTTRFQVITGPDMLFGNAKAPRIADVSDGVRHTILVTVTGPDQAILWTKPDELALDPSEPLKALGQRPDPLIFCVMVDAQPLVMFDDVVPTQFLALATPHGKEIVDADRYRREYDEQRWDTLEQAAKDQAGAHSERASASKTAAAAKSAAPNPVLSDPAKMIAIRKERSQKLKDILLAMHSYHDTHRQFPIAKNLKNVGLDGKPHLSWRVHLLPFLEQQPLYEQFKLDEPWDGPHNKALITKMPDIYRDRLDASESTKTRIVMFTGKGTPNPGPFGSSFREFKDGTSMTSLVAIAGTDKSVTWTQPADLEFDPSAPIKCLGEPDLPYLFVGMADGAVKVFAPTLPPEAFASFVTIAGGDAPPPNLAEFEVR